MSATYCHSLRFDADLCDGCMSCMRACPTAAVRVRNGRAVKLQDRCIDCSECIKACPKGAIIPLTHQMADLSRFNCTVAIPSAALYAQFDTEVLPAVIFAALKGCGFDDVEYLSGACDAVAVATEIFVSEYRGQYPLISSFCPTVVRLVQVKYPQLTQQMLPILAPREISARDAKARKSAETGLAPEQIGAVYITPCPGKIVSVLEHPGMHKSNLDAAISISDLFQTLCVAIARARDVDTNADGGETASGVSWALLGGYPRALPAENTLSVGGLPNVIRILDDIEKGRLRRYSFIECHACPEGCVGGCLTVENPYVARGRIIKLLQQLPSGPAVDRTEAERRYRQGEFSTDEPIVARPLRPLHDDIAQAIARMEERDRILSGLPRIDCGACGSPSCLAFAEDVVLGEAREESCILYWQRSAAPRVDGLAGLDRQQKTIDAGGQK